MRMLECTKQTIVSLSPFSGDLEFLEENTKSVDGTQYTAAAKIADFMKEKGYEEQGNQILQELEKYKSKVPLSADN